jgi:integrase
VISGVLGWAARHGAIVTNPVRDGENVPSSPERRPRALNDDERREWFAILSRDPKAVAADLPDLALLLLATGVRIGEALGLLWSEVDVDVGMVAITGQVIRVTGAGLVRGPTKSAAGQRVLALLSWGVEMQASRRSRGIRPEEPVFCDALGGFRDPQQRVPRPAAGSCAARERGSPGPRRGARPSQEIRREVTRGAG